MGEPLIVPFQQFGEAHPAQHLDGEDLLNAGFEAKETDCFAGLDIHHPHATGALAKALHEWNAAEHCALTHLRETDESQRSDKIYSARETRHLCDRLPSAPLEIDRCQASLPGFKHPELPLMPARRVRHGKSTEQDFVALYVHQDAALGLVGSPAARRVGFSQCGDVLGAAIDHGNAIQVTTIFRGQTTDKRRAPARRKTMICVERTETTEAGVDRPEL